MEQTRYLHSCNVIHDGSHYIATLIRHKKQTKRKREELLEIDIRFNEAYNASLQFGLSDGKKRKEQMSFVLDALKLDFPLNDEKELREYVQARLIKKYICLSERLKRLKRKLCLHQWNYFVTFTYDDDKCSEEVFRKKLRRCLTNLHTRRGWKYMCVWERGETGRLHMHAIIYVPNGAMWGSLEQKEAYNPKKKKMEKWTQNSEFSQRFGRNDFDPICPVRAKSGNSANYLWKYVIKECAKLIYSRAVPDKVELVLDVESDFQSDYECIIKKIAHKVIKFVLYDDIIDCTAEINGKFAPHIIKNRVNFKPDYI
ncbi:MAG: hypothetical protein FWD49_07685 [Firmicutes bacterium]|nr:hypothetical protein [Bacillota bacterium]